MSTANVVVVEGVLDALAIAAAAAQAGRSAEFAPCTTSGVAVTSAQAAHVIDLAAGRPPVIAMDGDEAGAEGSLRWLTRICLERHTAALVTRLPTNVDPADWIREHGIGGLTAFDTAHVRATATAVGVGVPGPELARIAITSGGDRVDRATRMLVPLAAALPRPWATQLLDQAGREMTRQGWNPNGQFTSALRRAIASAGLTAPDRDRPTGGAPSTGPGPARSQCSSGAGHRSSNSRGRTKVMRQSIDWVAEAVQSLYTAARRADELAAGDVFSSWAAVADQIRLVASGLDPAAISGEPRSWPSVRECLTAALEALDRVGPPDGPDDLRLWQWHLREVADLAARLEISR